MRTSSSADRALEELDRQVDLIMGLGTGVNASLHVNVQDKVKKVPKIANFIFTSKFLN
jgi:hypothetical protein